jgi:hypothetical protein
MEIKVIKNNLLIELLINSQINEQTITQLIEKYQDCNVVECKFKFSPNTKMRNTMLTDFESIAIILE